ncbi:hypothetical protein BV22DRAFT_456902 [Leucogyrophana mollusca]|uniref:Uncharacterized protein n=1 Tax=Leucogyrophana mollusca TaxID=85980 RepID=A0ACB8BHY5_9AGAM|nr:hypothetical protein BV22DRAFT_456902 [Leucogyrophana mollusca]
MCIDLVSVPRLPHDPPRQVEAGISVGPSYHNTGLRPTKISMADFPWGLRSQTFFKLGRFDSRKSPFLWRRIAAELDRKRRRGMDTRQNVKARSPKRVLDGFVSGRRRGRPPPPDFSLLRENASFRRSRSNFLMHNIGKRWRARLDGSEANSASRNVPQTLLKVIQYYEGASSGIVAPLKLP